MFTSAISSSVASNSTRFTSIIDLVPVDLSGFSYGARRAASTETFTGPSIGERFRDDLVFVFVHDVPEPLLAEHRDAVSVHFEHGAQLLHVGDVFGGRVAEPGNASGLPPVVAFRASPVEPSRLGKVLSKPRKGVAKDSTVGFRNVRPVSQGKRHLKDA